MRPELILVDVLDAKGAAPGDARSRRRALLEQGHRVRVLLLDPDPARAASPSAPGFERFGARAEMLAALAAARRGAPGAGVVVAGSARAASDIAPHIPKGAFAGWWPTTIEGPETAWWRSRPARFGWPASGGPRAEDDVALALDRAPIEPLGHARGRLPLWDGDYVLAPATPANGVGDALVRSFARVAGEHHGLDLVFLDAPDERLLTLARREGVGVRVHFAGPATREAELAWYASALAVVLASSAPFAACSLLRALACGAPVMAAGEGARASALRRWLMARELATPAQCAPVSSTSLRTVLERDDALTQVLARGKALVATRTVSCAPPARAVAAPEAA